MKETKALLAGEMSGHIFFADRYFGYDDAIYAASRVFEIACETPGPLSNVLADLEKTINTPELRVMCEEDKKFALVEGTKKRLVALGKGTVNDIDGIRIDFGDGWGLVRASNTQPVIVTRFEAKTKSRMEEIQTTVEAALKETAKQLGHAPLDTNGNHH
jgi:phosphomannomutase/phosphoglucomutase